VTRAERATLWLMATPFLLGVVALVAGPTLWTLAMAFTDANLIRPPTFVGLANLRELVGDPMFRLALRNSLLFAAVAVPLRLGLALAVAMLLSRPAPGSRFARVAAVAPAALPDVALALAFLWLFNPVYGPLNIGLDALGLPTPSWLTEVNPARWGVVLMSLFVIGEGVLLALVARWQIPRELEEMAAEQGAGRASTFARVTLPLLTPVLLLLAVRDTALSLQASFTPAYLVTEGGPPPGATTYLPLFAYREGFEYLRYGYAAAATLVMFAVTASAVWLEYRLIARWGRLGWRAGI
jgi:multiple sugar transport system permease protein